MFGVVMPRETMLMTSVSASTAQIDEHVSGLSACQRQRADLLERHAEVAAMFSRNWPEPDAHWLVMR